MYSTCLFCNGALGRNETIEHFPVGRRLAFDGAKGRLWAVCPRCLRWNLSPLEERWEAIEECERAFRDTRLRASTDNIGLARVGEGLELVRIGEPQRPEFAAWRYGARFIERQRATTWRMAGGTLGAAGIGLGLTGLAGPVLPVLAGAAAIVALGVGGFEPRPFSSSRPVRLTASDGHVLELGHDHLGLVGMRPGDAPGSFRIVVDYEDVSTYDWRARASVLRHAFFEGVEARRAARVLIPRVNGTGGDEETVRDAVSDIERAGGSTERYLENTFAQVRRRGLVYSGIASYPATIRLGLEMAVHEDDERRAVEGELAELESAWREAEEVAAIADALLVPPRVIERVEQLRRGLTQRGRDRG